jgi:hypothetical protein
VGYALIFFEAIIGIYIELFSKCYSNVNWSYKLVKLVLE